MDEDYEQVVRELERCAFAQPVSVEAAVRLEERKAILRRQRLEFEQRLQAALEEATA